MANNNGGNKKVAISFDEMIQADRKKRKAEQLAQQIFGKDRRASTPAGGNRKNTHSPAGGSLASRVGVTKAPMQPRAAALTSERRQNNAARGKGNNNTIASIANIANNANPRAQSNRDQRRPFRNEAAAATATTTSGPRGGLGQIGAAQVSASQIKQNDNVFGGSEINIRGAAGPYCVVASNFAPGTTAADIESVMAPIGGEMLGCKLISSNPTVIVEMVFVERSGADNVIAMFNNKKADGRLLYVYMKEGGPSQPLSNAQNTPYTASPAHTRPIQPAALPVPTPSPQLPQQPSDDTMEVDPESIAADELYVANSNLTPEDAKLNGSARSHSHANDFQSRAPREPREPYRPPPRNDRPEYRDDYAPRHGNPDVQDGRFGFPEQDFPRHRGGYPGGAYRDDRRGGGRFRDNGRAYLDSMGRGGGGRFRR